MLEKPDLQDERLAACLQDAYGLLVAQLDFLPLGADPHTAVYRAVAEDGSAYFVKLRYQVFDEKTVTIPKFLMDQGVEHIISPVATEAGHLWTELEPFTVILYPFVEGHNGYRVALSERQWCELGSAFKQIHTAQAPPTLREQIQQETYTPQWRDAVRSLLAGVGDSAPADLVAADLVAFLMAKKHEILALAGRAEQLAQALQAQPRPFVLCHADIHAGNVLLDAAGALYIVDWDEAIFAPKERDLMFIGGGLWAKWQTAQEEESWFYRGYGETEIDSVALAYYRFERIVIDIAVDCNLILQTDEDSADREQSLHYLKANFLPDNTIEMAYRADRAA